MDLLPQRPRFESRPAEVGDIATVMSPKDFHFYPKLFVHQNGIFQVHLKDVKYKKMILIISEFVVAQVVNR